jgi:hypothetical protein
MQTVKSLFLAEALREESEAEEAILQKQDLQPKYASEVA